MSFARLLPLLLIITCTLPLLVSQTTAATSDDWLMYQHDAAHTGYSSYTINIPLNLDNFGYFYAVGGVAVANGCIYFVSTNGVDATTLCAVDSSTGQLLWSSITSAQMGYFGATPAIADGYVYTSRDAFDISTGKLSFNYSNYACYGSPIVAGDVVLINTHFNSPFGPDGLVAINARTGAKMWVFKETNGHMPGFENHAPVIYNDVVYFACASGIYALNVKSGSQVWHLSLDAFGGYIAADDGQVYCVTSNISNRTNSLHCLDAASGNINWVCETGSGPLAIANGIVYVHPTAVDASSGKVIWNNTWLDDSPVVSGNTVFSTYIKSSGEGGFRAWTHGIIALDTSDGKILWNQTLTTSSYEKPDSITIAENTLFVSIGGGGSLNVFKSTQGNHYASIYFDIMFPSIQISVVIIGVVVLVLVIVVLYRKKERKIMLK